MTIRELVDQLRDIAAEKGWEVEVGYSVWDVDLGDTRLEDVTSVEMDSDVVVIS